MTNASYVVDGVDPDHLRLLVARYIYPSVTLPGQVFQPPYRYFCFYDYSHLQDATCWQDLSNASSPGGFQLIFLDPDFTAFRRDASHPYGVMQVKSGVSREELRQLINSSPTGEMGEAFIYFGPKCLLVPDSGSWVMWAERTSDLAIAAFPDREAQERFVASTPNWLVMQTVEEALRFMTKGTRSRLDDKFFLNPMARNYAQPAIW